MINLIQLKTQFNLKNTSKKMICTGGSVVECSLATRATRVRFPASAIFLFFLSLSLSRTYISICIGHFATSTKTIHAFITIFPFLEKQKFEFSSSMRFLFELTIPNSFIALNTSFIISCGFD